MSKATEALEKLLESPDEYVRLNAARLLQITDLDQQRINSEWAMRDRTLKIDEAQAREEANGQEIDRLAQFLLDWFPQAVGQATAVDTAISIIKDLLDKTRNASAD